MIGIPLRDVVAFLRQRGALSILHGAPFFYSNGPQRPPKQPVPAGKLATWDGEPVRLLGDEHHATLYLGDSEICPAAEGWASRLLALARRSSMPVMIQDCRASLCVWQVPLTSAVPYAVWQWVTHDLGDDGAWARIDGAPPATPAERLAAVLRYELGRAP